MIGLKAGSNIAMIGTNRRNIELVVMHLLAIKLITVYVWNKKRTNVRDLKIISIKENVISGY